MPTDESRDMAKVILVQFRVLMYRDRHEDWSTLR